MTVIKRDGECDRDLIIKRVSLKRKKARKKDVVNLISVISHSRVSVI